MSALRGWSDSRRAVAAAALGIAVAATGLASASAQTSLDALRLRDRELEAIRAEQKKAVEASDKLRGEIDSISADRRQLNQDLLATASRVRAAEAQIGETEARLEPLDARERSLRRSLDDRRATIAEVLAALQRMGRNPPPALMVRPEDALQSIRSAILLGAVLPEMRNRAQALAHDLSELQSVRMQIAAEKERFTRELAALADERQRVEALIETRQRRQADTEQALEAERQKAVVLARQADDLKELIGKSEQDLDGASRAARAAERSSVARAKDDRVDLAALRDPGRIAPAMAFTAAQGRLPLPVTGARVKAFGAPDKLGGTEKGLTIATRPGSQVTAPCDGWVVYAASFRNYGQVLILNAGDGYHVVLAGMDRISVNVGQFVLTGEPVAVMASGSGSGSQGSAAPASASNRPALYVEFRKDGTPIDPSPWWAASESEKVRG